MNKKVHFPVLRTLYWELSNKITRFQYLNALVYRIPGSLGQHIRSRLLLPHFKQAGKNIVIMQGVQYRGQQELCLADGVRIGIDCFLQASGGLYIGKNAMLGPGVKIWTVNHRFDELNKPIHEQGYDLKPVRIGTGTWIGANSFIMPGVTLPEGCIVSAGSVVGIKQYPPYSIISGNPARVVGKRN